MIKQNTARGITLALAALTTLSGCMPSLNDGNTERRGFLAGRDRPDEQHLPGPRKRNLAEGDVIVKAPDAYCVDPSVVTSDNFALLAECGTLNNTPAIHAEDRGVMTVSVSAAFPPEFLPQDMRPFLGEGQDVDTNVKGLAIKRINAGETAPLPGADPRYWRGAMQINGHVVTFAVYGPPDGAALEAHGKYLIEELAKNTQSASPRRLRAAKRVKSPIPRQQNAENSQQPRFGGIGRLFQINQSDTQ